jgi:poly-gamma-glutamate capsule biosynthesis protein CapA/YwtB (metallophosphatase superfamily)
MERREFLKKLGQVTALAGTSTFISQKSFAQPAKITLAGAGDCIIASQVSKRREQSFLNLVDIIRSADCLWGNCEITLMDIRKGYPGPKGLDMHVTCEPWGADELAWCGFDMLGLANNHAKDYGNEGLLSTIQNLQRVGIGYAGAGKDLQEASRPRYVDTPAGRVGQVSCTSSAPSWFMAAPSAPHTNGRPGLNLLRVKTEIELETEPYETLKAVRSKVYKLLGEDYMDEWAKTESKDKETEKKEGKDKNDKPETINYQGITYKKGKSTDVLTKAVEEDAARITDSLKIAKRNARLVILSIHAHEQYGETEIPAKFLQPFARACIDAGADVFFGTGPHLLRGIEIYKGKPIFYSLGNFFFQYQAVKQIAYETYRSANLKGTTLDPSKFTDKYEFFFKEKKFWESVVPFMTFQNNEVTEIKLYPIELGWKDPRHYRGVPGLAVTKEGEEIIARLGELSKPYKTAISFRDGLGYVHL